MAISLSDIRGLGEFATTNNWQLEFLTLPSGVTNNGIGINFRCVSVNIPKKTSEPVGVTVRGLPTVKQPGLYLPDGTLTLSIFETVDNFMAKTMLEWRELCYKSGTGEGKPKKDVEATIKLTRLNNEKKGIWQYTLIGAFLVNGEFDGLSETAEALKGTMEISYDDFTESAV